MKTIWSKTQSPTELLMLAEEPMEIEMQSTMVKNRNWCLHSEQAAEKSGVEIIVRVFVELLQDGFRLLRSTSNYPARPDEYFLQYLRRSSPFLSLSEPGIQLNRSHQEARKMANAICAAAVNTSTLADPWRGTGTKPFWTIWHPLLTPWWAVHMENIETIQPARIVWFV